MNKETIENAAKDYVMPNERIIPLMEAISAKEGFINGAHWRINSVWHDGKEIPKMNEYVLMNLGHRCLVMCFITIPLFLSFRNRENIVCWAYISDLLPDRKEDAR